MTRAQTRETPVATAKKRRLDLLPASVGTRRDSWSYLLIFGFVAVAVTGLIWYRVATEYQTVMNHWQARQTSLADDRARMVSAWLKESQADAQLLAANPAVRAALSERPGPNSPAQRGEASQGHLRETLDRHAKTLRYAGIYILNYDGRVIAQSTGSVELDPSVAAGVREAARLRRPQFNLLGPSPEKCLVSASVPFFTETPGAEPPPVAGAVVVLRDAASSLFPILQDEPVPTRTGETVLMRREGDEAIYVSPLRFPPPGTTQLRRRLGGALNFAARAAFEGRQAFGEFTDYRGVRVLASTRRIPLTGWGLVRKIDREEALADYYGTIRLEILAAALVLFALGGLLAASWRNHASRALKRQEAHLREVLESAPDAMTLSDQEGRIVLVNRETELMSGYTRAELLGQPVSLLVPERVRRKQDERYGKYFADPAFCQATHRLESIRRRKDDSEYPVEVSLNTIQFADHVLVCAAVRDVTGRKQAEQELKRVNRALRTISECNKAIVRATEEPQLLEDICGILVGAGGYLMAWVGYSEHDESKSVRPVAHAGLEEGYLQTASITWADLELGRGPTGTAIRKGRPVVARDILADPSLIPWREEALKRGYASSIALPILLNGQVLGALTIYAQEADAFDEEEVTLLTELSHDLAYGIQALRTRAERLRAEVALRQSEATLRSVFKAAPVGICIMKDRVFHTANDLWHEIIGYTEAELRGRTPRQLYESEEEYRRVGRELYTDLPKRGLISVETRLRRGDGTLRDVILTAALLNPEDPSAGDMVAIRDVTEHKRTEAARRESERKYQELVENANSIILHWTRDGRIIFLNEFGQRFFGYTEAEICGRHVIGTIVPETGGGRDLHTLMDEICKNPAAFEQNVNENMRRNGERVWIAWTNKVVLHPQGQVAEILSIGTDVTARKRAEEELRATQASLEQRVIERTAELAVARDRAEAADRTKSAFLATMSHELRTPLNSIIGFTGLLLQSLAGPLNEEQTKQLGMVKDSGQHLLALINDVLDISKIEAGQIEIANAPFDLPASICKVVETVTPLADKKRLPLTAQIAPDVSRITSDRRRVEQILLNLLSNAIKFTERGAVTLTAETVPGAVRVSVADTGLGIKRENLDKLFQPFRQLDTGLTRQHEGTGLGLAICKRLVERLGGTITVESEWGKGSTFQCTLPIHPEGKS